ncbi:MAG: DUF1178 family protein [Proteobacteria bacterium]|nr:DUF1178 family protein [Pseudomonadota bacterium]
MIVYELKCSSGHVFEGWFRDAAAFDRQAAAGKVACAVCGDSQIAKAPMAPRLAKRRDAAPAETKPGLPPEAAKLLADLREKVESECDYVGERFADEARRMHYGEAEKRGIYGEASDQQAKELVDEGIEVKKIPWVPRGDA